MLLGKIAYNETCPKLQVYLSDPENATKSAALATHWSEILTAYGLFQHKLDYFHNWLLFTIALDESNQLDYF